MKKANQGLTSTYNRFHNPADESDEILTLRKLQVQMDTAVASAYGWSDLSLAHGFHQTKQGVRYAIDEPARRLILERLVALNHQRHADELAVGARPKRITRGGGRGKRQGSDVNSLFG